jgi:hypothetical protein
MPTDSELREMALEIIDMVYLRLNDEICEDVLIEDLSLGVATGCREDLRQRTSELPPEVFAVCPERIFAYGFVNLVFETVCCNCIVFPL